MYNKEFAKIYNQEWAYFSENLADNILKIPTSFNSILDLGCGTGNFLKKLEKHFNRTVGIDISADMIDIAKQNCKNSEFIVGSVTDFNLNEKFDLITCNFDMINHLNTVDEWEKVFYLAHKHLREGGVFLFDVNTIYKMKNFDYKESVRESDNYKIVLKNTKIDDNRVRMYVQIFDKQGKRVACVDEIESFYTEETILKLLNNVGFSNVSFADKELKPVDNFERNRLFVICKK